MCDYSGTDEPVIKGNIGSGGDRIFHTPESGFYSRTQIDEDSDERWFCTVEEALGAGWRAPQTAGAPTETPSASPSPTETPTPIPQATATNTPAPPAPTPISQATATNTPAPPAPTPIPQATATQTPAPATPAPTTVATGGTPDVQITTIFFDGEVKQTEADEYVEIANLGGASQDLSGWKLVDTADGTPEFEFAEYLLEPGARIRVYTNEAHPEWGGFSFGRGTAVWSNCEPDTAGLFDDGGNLVSSMSYPPGC